MIFTFETFKFDTILLVSYIWYETFDTLHVHFIHSFDTLQLKRCIKYVTFATFTFATFTFDTLHLKFLHLIRYIDSFDTYNKNLQC